MHAARGKKKTFTSEHKIIGSIILGGAAAFAVTISARRTVLAERPPAAIPEERLIRLSEIRQHNGKAETYWVYRGDRVYDITDWVCVVLCHHFAVGKS
jgi:hypothetical protein